MKSFTRTLALQSGSRPALYSLAIALRISLQRYFFVMTAAHEVDEATPLLQVQPKKRTPLPWSQLIIVLFLQLGEPLTSQVIYPFAPQVGFLEKMAIHWTVMLIEFV